MKLSEAMAFSLITKRPILEKAHCKAIGTYSAIFSGMPIEIIRKIIYRRLKPDG